MLKSGSSGTAGSGKKYGGWFTVYIRYKCTATPWIDVTLEDVSFNGYLVIALPDNTNKNVAKTFKLINISQLQ